MKLVNHGFRALALSVFLWPVAGCRRHAETPASQPSAPIQTVVSPGGVVTPARPTEKAAELQTAIKAAQAAAKAQNYFNAVQRFDALRSAGSLTGDQLAQIQDAEVRMMRKLAAKAAAGDQNALRQFRELAARPRTGRLR